MHIKKEAQTYIHKTKTRATCDIKVFSDLLLRVNYTLYQAVWNVVYEKIIKKKTWNNSKD